MAIVKLEMAVCDFCGKVAANVAFIVVASRGIEKARSPAICDGCIDLCVELANEHRRKQEGPEHAQG
ncbi:ClpX C4-type zinc finger protein [Bordetella bronchiseptica]|uniref:ClpX C4-type zinc finger protein n=1 Tax=Bordetella bronchiseptica TaxID=518 RepID=UPI000C195212|nr:ClpX C4-type zinc finger protein [Bordetella bronchiseptica]